MGNNTFVEMFKCVCGTISVLSYFCQQAYCV